MREAVARGTEFLKRHGVETPRLDADLLLCKVLGLDRLGLFMQMDRPLTGAERDAARDLLLRRSKHEPVAYILGEREFLGRTFAVRPGVLIPRPETELLVERAGELLTQAFPEEVVSGQWHLLELGAGSGCVCVSLADIWREARITATEVSDVAVSVTVENANRHGVADRIDIRLVSDWSGLPQNEYHAVIANPPYIPAQIVETLMSDVYDYEPHVALSGGEDGMDVIRMMLAHAPRVLRPGGFMLIEIGVEIGPQVGALPTELEFVEVRKDYDGHDRLALWRKPL